METAGILWSIATAILLFVGIYWVYLLEKRVKSMEERYQKILALAEGTDQVTIINLLARLDAQEKRLGRVEMQLLRIGDILPHTVQGYGVVRYDAFPDMGGEQSFSLALVDENGSGALLTSLHARDDTRVYAKPLTQWRSPYSLSAEEQRALGQARQVAESAAPSQEVAAGLTNS